jgi:putative endonuclease
MGVATTYRVPVNRRRSPFVKRAMNREGARAEDLCADLMRAAGLKLIERTWRCRLGEIDLIAEDRDVLVFAEVRMRSPGGFGGAAESVTAAKRSRIIAAARLYLTRRPEATCRFDVFLVDGPPRHVQWIRNAFGE